MKIRIIAAVLLVCLILLPSFQTHASEIHEPDRPLEEITNEVDEAQTDRFETTSPWLQGNEDSSIYSNPLDGGDDVSSQITPDKPGIVEKHISELFRNIASSIIELLNDNLGASLDSIVYGRVGSGHPNRVNIFSFELRKGNPYGVTGAVAYSVLRSMVYVFMALQFLYTLAKASFGGQTARSREDIKSRFYTLVLNFCLLALMPYFLDVVLYIRDVVLYGIKEVTSQLITGGASLNLSDAFYIVSESSGSFVDAVMYMGTIVLTIYFVCIYVSIALDMLLCFVIFPITCVLGKQNKSALDTWLMSILSDICTPVIDAVLLLVPLLTSVMLSDVVRGVRIIQLLMCMLIIPMRGQIKEKLGLSRGGERNGIFGTVAGLAAARMVGNKLKAGIGRIKDAYGDAKRSRMHGEMDEIDEAEEQELVSDYNHGRMPSSGHDVAGGVQERSGEAAESVENSGYATRSTMAADQTASDAVFTERQFENTPEVDAGIDMGEVTPDGAQPARTREDVERGLNQAIEDKQNAIADLRVEKAGYQQKEKEQRLAMVTAESNSMAYKQARKNAAEYALKASETDEKIQKENKQLAQLRAQSKRASRRPSGGRSAGMSEFDAKRAEVLSKYANINNFEQPEFKGVLSSARLKELYRARAVRSGVQTAAGAAGAVGGGVLLASMGSFMPPTTAMMMAAGGTAVGATAAEAGAFAASEGVRILTRMGGGGSSSASAGSAGVKQAEVKMMPGGGPRVHQETTGSGEVPENSAADSKAVSTEQVNMQVDSKMENPLRDRSVNTHAIQHQAIETLNQMISQEGKIKNNQIIEALKEANLQVEAYFISLDEEARAGVTQLDKQEYRIEIQTDTIVGTLLNRMVQEGTYVKGSAEYKYAKDFLLKRVQKIVEEKNQSLL